MMYYKIVLSSDQKDEQNKIENFAESIRSTLKNDTEFSVFSTTSSGITTIYFSTLAFELCTVLSEKFGFESFDCSSDDFKALSEFTE